MSISLRLSSFSRWKRKLSSSIDDEPKSIVSRRLTQSLRLSSFSRWKRKLSSSIDDEPKSIVSRRLTQSRGASGTKYVADVPRFGRCLLRRFIDDDGRRTEGDGWRVVRRLDASDDCTIDASELRRASRACWRCQIYHRREGAKKRKIFEPLLRRPRRGPPSLPRASRNTSYSSSDARHFSFSVAGEST